MREEAIAQEVNRGQYKSFATGADDEDGKKFYVDSELKDDFCTKQRNLVDRFPSTEAQDKIHSVNAPGNTDIKHQSLPSNLTDSSRKFLDKFNQRLNEQPKIVTG